MWVFVNEKIYTSNASLNNPFILMVLSVFIEKLI